MVSQSFWFDFRYFNNGPPDPIDYGIDVSDMFVIVLDTLCVSM